MAEEIIKFHQNTKIKSSEVNQNFENLKNLIIENTEELQNFLEKEINKLSGSFVPTGAVMQFPYAAIPTGYLKCDGAEYLISDYPDLYTLIGTTYGSSDSTKFKVPDWRDCFLRGAGPRTLSIGLIQEPALPNIKATFKTRGGGAEATGAVKVSGTAQVANYDSGSSNSSFDFNASRSSSVYKDGVTEVLPRYSAVIYCIKY